MPPTADPLQSWLETIGPDVCKAVNGWLHQEAQLSLMGANPSQLIHRLFYDCLWRDPLESHAGLLRQVGCRYEDGSPVPLEEAVQLLDLACQGKPHKAGLRWQLRAWRQRRDRRSPGL